MLMKPVTKNKKQKKHNVTRDALQVFNIYVVMTFFVVDIHIPD